MIPLQMAFREKHPVTHLVFSPDQSAVAVAQPHAGVTLVDRATGRTRAVCPMPRRDVLTGLAFTGDGQLLVAASAKGLSVFDAATGAWVANSTHSPNNGLMLATSAAGVVGVKGDGRRREWPTAALLDKSFNLQWPGGRAPAKAVALCPTGRAVIGTQASGRTVLFDLARVRVAAELERPEPPGARALPRAKFCPLGRRFAINDGRTLDVYAVDGVGDEDEDEQRTETPLVQRADGTNPTNAVAAAPMPHVALAPVFALKPHKASDEPWYPPFALLADGRGLLVKRPRNRIQLWDAPTGALVNEWSWRLEWVTCVAVSTDGLTAVAGGRFGRVLLWDLD